MGFVAFAVFAAGFDGVDFAATFTLAAFAGFAFAAPCFDAFDLGAFFAGFFARELGFVVILPFVIQSLHLQRGSNASPASARTFTRAYGTSVVRNRARDKKAVCVAPAILTRLGLETLHGPFPFRVRLRDFTQLDGCLEPAGFDFTGIGASPRTRTYRVRNRFPACPPRLEARNELSHACTDEMILQPPSFKPEAGSGEV
jgi:hypothetical protein